MNTKRAILICLVLVVAGAVIVFSLPSTSPKAGANCRVQFRRDALGVNSPSPIPIATVMHNGAEVTLSGQFVRMNSDWLVLKTGEKSETWILRSAILYLTITE
jgi:hypothetical protein